MKTGSEIGFGMIRFHPRSYPASFAFRFEMFPAQALAITALSRQEQAKRPNMTATFAKSAQPSLADLTARFLARPTAAEVEAGVEPHEVLVGFTADARTTWTEATAAAKLLGVKDLPSALPTDWAAHTRQAATDFLPLALGHFPQQVRDVNRLLSPKPAAAAETCGWSITSVKPTLANLLLRAAAARSGSDFVEAARLLDDAEALADKDAMAVVRNERAALLWQQGRTSDAVALWEQTGNVVSAFNLGVAALATGRKADAATHLKRAVEGLPETSGWQHLARLYLALAS